MQEAIERMEGTAGQTSSELKAAVLDAKTNAAESISALQASLEQVRGAADESSRESKAAISDAASASAKSLSSA